MDSILFAINIDNAELNGGCQSEGEARPDTGSSGTLEPEAQVAPPTPVPATGELPAQVFCSSSVLYRCMNIGAVYLFCDQGSFMWVK